MYKVVVTFDRSRSHNPLYKDSVPYTKTYIVETDKEYFGLFCDLLSDPWVISTSGFDYDLLENIRRELLKG